jgi:hypothetical protein
MGDEDTGEPGLAEPGTEHAKEAAGSPSSNGWQHRPLLLGNFTVCHL